MSEAPKKRDLSFSSDAELKKLFLQLSLSMHHKNRVALGESRFVHAMAELTARMGEVWEQHRKDPTTRAAFGDGYTPGTLSRQEQSAFLVSLLYPELAIDAQ